MASPSSLVCEDQLLCSICLDVFKEPVSTPCGHNYCKACITDYWNSTTQTRCPLCKKRFKQRPTLRCNTGFRDMIEQLKSLSVSSLTEEQQPAEPGDVPCDICLPPKLKALKTCVVCLASYCSLHMEPHHRVSSFKKHLLIAPISNLEHRVCQKHNTMLKLYCTTDETCVCPLCLQDDHALHRCVPLENAFREGKASAERGIAALNMIEKAKYRDIDQVKSYIEQRKKKKDSEIAEIREAFTALVDSLQKHQEKLVDEVEQKYTNVMKPHEDRVFKLQKGVKEIQQRQAKLEELVKTDDHLHFLLNKPGPFYPPQDKPPEYDPDEDTSLSSTVKPALKTVESILNAEMKRVFHKLQNSEEEGSAFATWIPPKDKLMMIQQNDAIDLRLDPDSANVALSVYEEGKAVLYNPMKPAVMEPRSSFFSKRFQNLPFILSTEGFSSGHFYFEVEVSSVQHWVLGVLSENFNRLGPSRFSYENLPGPSDGAWIINPLYPFSESFAHFLSPNIQNVSKIGVFVDYEKGEVLFYDVDARVVIFSYRECQFKEPVPLLKSFIYGLGGASVSSRTKLYPVFGIFSLFDCLKITPVAVTV